MPYDLIAKIVLGALGIGLFAAIAQGKGKWKRRALEAEADLEDVDEAARIQEEARLHTDRPLSGSASAVLDRMRARAERRERLRHEVREDREA